ncbi:MAG: helix-turn-helix domain-containing protein [Bacillota bacterium]|nr:helix-turn-helix domain-containing protein [Bacillota bacterium]
MAVGPRLRYWRQQRGVSVEDLADRLTIAPDCLGEVEEGRRRMAMAAWQEAADFLQVPLEELLRDGPLPDPASPAGGSAAPGSPAAEWPVAEAGPGAGGEPEKAGRCDTGGHVKLRVGNTVRTLREQKGITVTDLARATGLSPAHISEIERGRTAPSIRTLEKLARALGVSAGVLVRSVGANGVGEKLRRLRERLGLTQKGVAEKAGVSYGLIGQIESGRTQSSVTTLSLLAEALGVSPCYFLMDEEEVLELTRSLSPEVAELLSQPRVREFLARVAGLNRSAFDLVMAVVDVLMARLPRQEEGPAEPLRELGDLLRDMGPEERRFLVESARFLVSRRTREAG